MGVKVGAIGVPVAFSDIALETPEVESVSVSVAVRGPTCEGVKTIFKLQLLLEFSVALQELPVTAKSLALAPVTA
jgi:hypothetical protein